MDFVAGLDLIAGFLGRRAGRRAAIGGVALAAYGTGFPALTTRGSASTLSVPGKESYSMRSNDRSDFLFDIDRDIPTTLKDVIALRKNRPARGENWLEDLRRLTQDLPGIE